jgi:hypothetical protein
MYAFEQSMHSTTKAHGADTDLEKIGRAVQLGYLLHVQQQLWILYNNGTDMTQCKCFPLRWLCTLMCICMVYNAVGCMVLHYA